jgi:hypothetical protein
MRDTYGDFDLCVVNNKEVCENQFEAFVTNANHLRANCADKSVDMELRNVRRTIFDIVQKGFDKCEVCDVLVKQSI